MTGKMRARGMCLGLMTTIFALSATGAGAAPKKPEPGGEKRKDPAFETVADTPGLPRVLLIGDSISIGYTVPVRDALKGKANVHRIPENGGPTSRGVEKIDEWLGEGPWDVIHFNFGLHDLKQIDGNHQVPIADYEKNLRLLVERMKKAGAVLVWCSTTPVPDGKLNPPRAPADVVRYNAAAARIMKETGVRTDDLYAFALPRLKNIQQPVNVHFTPSGSKTLAEQVSASILDALKERTPK